MTVRARKLSTFSCLFLAHALSSGVQGQSLAQWSFKAAGCFTVVRDPLGPHHGPRTGQSVGGAGWLAGAGWEWRTAHFGFHTGLSIAVGTTGYDFDEGSQGYPEWMLQDGYDRGRRSMRTMELQLPIGLTCRRWEALRLDGGVCVGKLLRATDMRKGMRTVGGEEMELDERTDATANLTAWSFSADLGFVVEGPHGLHFEARYLHGLTDLDAPTGGGPSYARQVQVGMVYVPGRYRD